MKRKAERKPETFQDRLQRFMKSREWRRSDLAAKADLDLDTIHKWFQRLGSKPQVEQLEKLAEHIGLSPTWLVLGQGPELLGSSRTVGELADDLRNALAKRIDEDQDSHIESGLLPPAEQVLRDILDEAKPRYREKCYKAKDPFTLELMRAMNGPTRKYLSAQRANDAELLFLREQIEYGPAKAVKRMRKRSRASIRARLDALDAQEDAET